MFRRLDEIDAVQAGMWWCWIGWVEFVCSRGGGRLGASGVVADAELFRTAIETSDRGK